MLCSKYTVEYPIIPVMSFYLQLFITANDRGFFVLFLQKNRYGKENQRVRQNPKPETGKRLDDAYQGNAEYKTKPNENQDIMLNSLLN